MKINKQAVLDKINAYYDSVAAAEHDGQLAKRKRWDAWQAQEAKKSAPLALALRQLAVDVDGGQLVTKAKIGEAVEKLAHDRTVPWDERQRRGGSLDWYEFPIERPVVESVTSIRRRLQSAGRFTDLLGVLANMVGDEVAISALQKLGVLDASDARLIFSASKA